VLRTFSKIYGLAGLRVGFGISCAQLIAPLEKVRQPFNTNSIGQLAAAIALEDKGYAQQARNANKKALSFWQQELGKRQVPLIPTSANFFLADFSGAKISTEQVYQQCLRKGLILQPVGNYGFADFLRITTGTDEENEFAISVLNEII
jgi:histidinol-phosphate aminotransferase